MYKEIHTETEEEIKDNNTPSHFIFPVYVDLVVDTIPKNFKKIMGFDPIDEPLLKAAFEKGGFYVAREFGKNLLLPKPEILLAMKVNSIPNRDRGHKKVKDICDLFALAWYSDINLDEVNLAKRIPKEKLQKCLNSITDDDLDKAAAQLGHKKEELKRIIGIICEKE